MGRAILRKRWDFPEISTEQCSCSPGCSGTIFIPDPKQLKQECIAKLGSIVGEDQKELIEELTQCAAMFKWHLDTEDNYPTPAEQKAYLLDIVKKAEDLLCLLDEQDAASGAALVFGYGDLISKGDVPITEAPLEGVCDELRNLKLAAQLVAERIRLAPGKRQGKARVSFARVVICQFRKYHLQVRCSASGKLGKALNELLYATGHGGVNIPQLIKDALDE